jgi:hypothetical protein
MKKNIFTMLALVAAMSAGAETNDVTSLLRNANFEAGLSGWEVTGQDIITLSGNENEGIPTIQGKGAFAMRQTIEGLENGIYLVQLNGFFDQYPLIGDCWNYGTTLSANGNSTPLMVNREDMLDKRYAQDRKNCYITEETEGTDAIVDMTYYLPFSQQGASYAFAGGRYQNSIAVEVTDGTLTVGIQNPGWDKYDWTVFGNLTLTRLGEDDASEALESVAKGLLKRAKVIVKKNVPDFYAECHNFSKELREELTQFVSDTEKAETFDIQLVNSISDMLSRVQREQEAYQNGISQIEAEYCHIINMWSEGRIGDQEFMEFSEAYDVFWGNYVEGTLDTVNETEVNNVKATRAFQMAVLETGIQSTPISQPSSSALYDLSGRKLQQKPTKGIFIQNGKKVLVK